MDRNEIRYRIIASLLQAKGPLTLAELVIQCKVAQDELPPALADLVAEGSVIKGDLVLDRPRPQYCWATRWRQREGRGATSRRRELGAVMSGVDAVSERELDVDSEPAQTFYQYVINEYSPPPYKRFLVVFQCSVRRPFSSSPSHAAMRRAIAVATGCDPRHDFENCPVHVVVLASKIGPVPYELEDLYPANVRGGGVKRFSDQHYAHVKPILADRMAQYIITHRQAYDRVTTFTEGRYGEVMRAAREILVDRCQERIDFPILPRPGEATIVRIGESHPRQYWARYWIQLYLEVVSWLEPAQQALAQARLDQLDVQYRNGTAKARISSQVVGDRGRE